MANDQISIKVNIGDRIYPLKIQANEEEYVRKAAKILNDKMGFFNSNFSVKDNIDGLAMAALEFTVDALNKSKENDRFKNIAIDFSPIEKQLSELESILNR
ncbi:MAG: hypothetical protein RLZZ60_121 [Bacteroidota bacterium]|jgi:cell division protein ZapA